MAIEVREIEAQVNPTGDIPGFGRVTLITMGVGASNRNEVILSLLSSPRLSFPPALGIFAQPRQGDNTNHGFPDVFGVQVISADNAAPWTFAVKRLDANVGWGQNLNIDLFVIDGTAR